jgi:N-acetylglucosamine malate deacetylase 2
MARTGCWSSTTPASPATATTGRHGGGRRRGQAAGLAVLAWTLPAAIAARLQADTGAPFAGRPADEMDICIRVSRTRQRRAALLHASQISPCAVLWRRLQLQGDCEHLRWIR